MTTEQQVPGISLQDLAGCVAIIDLCSERGAFKGPELEYVGKLRGRVAEFVKANTPQEEPQAETQEGPAE
jgi:hypothetical protein